MGWPSRSQSPEELGGSTEKRASPKSRFIDINYALGREVSNMGMVMGASRRRQKRSASQSELTMLDEDLLFAEREAGFIRILGNSRKARSAAAEWRIMGE